MTRPLYPLARGLAWLLARGLFDLRPTLLGAEHLPRDERGRIAGGWIAVVTPHRRWIDPFLVVLLLPAEPQPYFLAEGRTVRQSLLRRILFRMIGGVVPITRGHGAAGFDEHVEAARRVLAADNVFVIFPERGGPSPAGESRPFSAGIGYIGLRTGAPLVPIALGGNEELYRGRRLALAVQPAADARELAGLAPDGPMPEPGSPEERDAAHAVAERLRTRAAPAVAALRLRLERLSAGDRRHWRWLSDWLS